MRLTSMPQQTDDELVRSAARGNELAFAELVGRHRHTIVRIIRRFFQKHDEVEEMAHISFIEAWFAISSYRGGEAHSFGAWLARIAVNSCYDELRRQRRRKENAISQLTEAEAVSLFDEKPARSSESGIEDELISRDLTDKLLGLLEPVDRQVFSMVKSGNYSVAEVARNVGWTETKVKMRIHRSRSILRRRLHRLL